MGIVIFIIFLSLIALGGLAAAIFGRNVGTKGVGGAVTALFGIALFLTFLIGGMQSVPVKSVGVGQAFGTVNGSVYGPGLHETWQPWVDTTDIDETVQTTTFADKGNDSGSSCNGGLYVRIGGQQTACASITIQWQIRPEAASMLYQDYANQGDLMTTVTNSVVIRELEQVTNNVTGGYNPITDVQSVTGSNTDSSQFATFGPKILSTMRQDIGTKVNVLSVLLLPLHYDSQIENQLSQIQQSFASYAVAEENVKVNEEKALAYTKLGAPTLAQLVAQCITAAGSNAGQCIPGAVSKISLSNAPTGS